MIPSLTLQSENQLSFGDDWCHQVWASFYGVRESRFVKQRVQGELVPLPCKQK